jgi:hypothetical protein
MLTTIEANLMASNTRSSESPKFNIAKKKMPGSKKKGQPRSSGKKALKNLLKKMLMPGGQKRTIKPITGIRTTQKLTLKASLSATIWSPMPQYMIARP